MSENPAENPNIPTSPVNASIALFDAARKLADRIDHDAPWNHPHWPEAQAVARAVLSYDDLIRRTADAIERSAFGNTERNEKRLCKIDGKKVAMLGSDYCAQHQGSTP